MDSGYESHYLIPGASFVLAGFASGYWISPYLAPLFFVAAAVIALSLKMANARGRSS